jgi:two-component system chemotaxis sensor kinase CheA
VDQLDRRFLGSFKAETGEHIQALNKGLLELEEDPGAVAVLESLLREIHTIKGSAGMIEFDSICDIAHGIEDVLIEIKDGKLEFGAVSGVLFNSLDAIEIILEAEIQGDEPEVKSADVLAQLEMAQKAQNLDPDNIPDQKSLREILAEKKIVFKEELDEAMKEQNTVEAYQFEETIRVSIDKLDSIANTVGEIAINRAKYDSYLNELNELIGFTKKQSTVINEIIEQIESQSGEGEVDNDSSMDQAVMKLKSANLNIVSKLTSVSKREQDTFASMEMITAKLQSDVMALRMLPVSTVFDIFPRVVRDIANEYDKKVTLAIKGADTELDRKMLEQIKDPLMHLIRNAIDHGIEDPEERAQSDKPEAGKIVLAADQEGDRIVLQVIDDGRGLDIEKITSIAIEKLKIDPGEIEKMSEADILKLIFVSGVSTKSSITDISGRGVGMDVVRKNIEDNLSGEIAVESQPGKGTTFTLILPLTLATTPSVLVESGGQIFAIPANLVQLGLQIEDADIHSIEGNRAIRVIDSTVPLVRMEEVLNLSASRGGDRSRHDQRLKYGSKHQVVVIEHAHHRIAFMIDRLIEEQNIIVKSLEAPLNKIKNIAGATILEQGEIVPILHVPDLIDSARQMQHQSVHETFKHVSSEARQKRILVVEDSLTTRALLKSIISSLGYEVITANDGVEGLNILTENKTDLVLTDIQMPEMDGLELARLIKQDPEIQNIPVVIVTSLDSEDEVRKGMEAGAEAYIKKGEFDQKVMLEMLQRLIG